jgi:hypothetical protein
MMLDQSFHGVRYHLATLLPVCKILYLNLGVCSMVACAGSALVRIRTSTATTTGMTGRTDLPAKFSTVMFQKYL